MGSGIRRWRVKESFPDNVQTVLDLAPGAQNFGKILAFLEGDANDIIPRLAQKQKVDLVIMGTVARTGLPGFFMGNTAETILNQLNCSVLAIKPEGFVSPVKPGKE